MNSAKLEELISKLATNDKLKEEVEVLKKLSEDMKDPKDNYKIMGPSKDDLYTNKQPQFGSDVKLESTPETPAQEPSGFTEGDRVKLLKAVAEIPQLPVGTVGTVINIQTPQEGMIGVEWELKQGYWNMYPDEIEKLKVAKTNVEASLIIESSKYKGYDIVHLDKSTYPFSVRLNDQEMNAFEFIEDAKEWIDKNPENPFVNKKSSIDWHVVSDGNDKYKVIMNDSMLKETFNSNKEAWDWINDFMKKNAALQECHCGSKEQPQLEYDARGIPLGYMCSKCKKDKLSHYREDVLTNPDYEADEQIEASLNDKLEQLASDVYDRLMKGELEHSSDGYRYILDVIKEYYDESLTIDDYVELVEKELDIKAYLKVTSSDEKEKVAEIFKTQPKKLNLFSEMVKGSFQLKEIKQEDVLEWDAALAKTVVDPKDEDAFNELADIALRLFKKTR